MEEQLRAALLSIAAYCELTLRKNAKKAELHSRLSEIAELANQVLEDTCPESPTPEAEMS